MDKEDLFTVLKELRKKYISLEIAHNLSFATIEAFTSQIVILDEMKSFLQQLKDEQKLTDEELVSLRNFELFLKEKECDLSTVRKILCK